MSEQLKRIAYVSFEDAIDIKKDSRSIHYTAKALMSKFDVTFIRPIPNKPSFMDNLKKRYYRRVLKQKYDRMRNPAVLKDIASQVKKQLADKQIDLVIALSTLPVAYLDCDIPIIIWWDATFKGWSELSRGYINYSNETTRDANLTEQSALDRCSLFLGFTDWAARTTYQNYHISSNKVKVLVNGPNMECHRTVAVIKNLISNRNSREIQLLFCATSWFAKGGDIAFEVARQLNELGFPTVLTVVGCNPIIQGLPPPYLNVLGFVSKAKLEEAYSQSHFLLFLTKRDCMGKVVLESNSFGVPVISTDVGGVPDVITNGSNGHSFSAYSPASIYRDYIIKIMSEPFAYETLAMNSFNEYQTRFDWNVIMDQFAVLVEKITNEHRVDG